MLDGFLLGLPTQDRSKRTRKSCDRFFVSTFPPETSHSELRADVMGLMDDVEEVEVGEAAGNLEEQ